MRGISAVPTGFRKRLVKCRRRFLNSRFRKLFRRTTNNDAPKGHANDTSTEPQTRETLVASMYLAGTRESRPSERKTCSMRDTSRSSDGRALAVNMAYEAYTDDESEVTWKRFIPFSSQSSPSVMLDFADVSAEAIVDTGATRTMMTKKVVHKIIGKDLPGLKPTRYRSTQADNSPMIIYGSYSLDFKLGQNDFKQEFIIYEGADNTILLGYDFLKKHHLIVYPTGLGTAPSRTLDGTMVAEEVILAADRDYTIGPGETCHVRASLHGTKDTQLTARQKLAYQGKKGLVAELADEDRYEVRSLINTVGPAGDIEIVIDAKGSSEPL